LSSFVSSSAPSVDSLDTESVTGQQDDDNSKADLLPNSKAFLSLNSSQESEDKVKPIWFRIPLPFYKLPIYNPQWTFMYWVFWFSSALFSLCGVIALASLTYTIYSTEWTGKHWVLLSTDGVTPGFFAVGQRATGIIAIGQFAVGIITVGQMTFGVINLSQVGVGLLFSTSMCTASFGYVVALVHFSGVTVAGVVGVTLFRPLKALLGVNVLAPFLFRDCQDLFYAPVTNKT